MDIAGGKISGKFYQLSKEEIKPIPHQLFQKRRERYAYQLVIYTETLQENKNCRTLSLMNIGSKIL